MASSSSASKTAGEIIAAQTAAANAINRPLPDCERRINPFVTMLQSPHRMARSRTKQTGVRAPRCHIRDGEASDSLRIFRPFFTRRLLGRSSLHSTFSVRRSMFDVRDFKILPAQQQSTNSGTNYLSIGRAKDKMREPFAMASASRPD
jgi:hypothetical protein